MIGSFKEMDKKRQAFDAKQPTAQFTHPFFQSPVLPVFGSMLSGMLLALGFPGYGNSTLVYAAMVPLLFAVQSASVKKAAWLGLLSGFVFFMMSLSWLQNLTGMVTGAGLKASALLGYAVLSIYCALYFVPFTIAAALGIKQWVGNDLRKNIRFMFALTMVWVGCEYLRGFLFTGFPWNPLGVSQYANPSIIQIAEWGGVHMVSAYIVWMNVGIFITFRQYTHGTRARKYRPHYELMIGILPVALSVAHGIGILFNKAEFHETVNVALIQPNIAQSDKWDVRKDQEIRERLEELTSAAARLTGLDIIIWPETAVPDFLRPRGNRISYDLVDRLVSEGVPLLVGTMDYTTLEGRTTYYNSSILVGTDGLEIAKYDKQHLVPFGEYVPFPKIMSKFTPVEVDFGRGGGSTVFPLEDKASFSTLICFEDTVSTLAVNATRAGARWLINQTNDGWFDPSAQSEQHLAHAVFRCVENRIPMARCCNTGVTCIIDAYGNVTRNLDPLTKGFTTGLINPRPEGLEQTFYTEHGNAFAKVSLIAGATVLFVLRSNNRKQRKKDADKGK